MNKIIELKPSCGRGIIVFSHPEYLLSQRVGQSLGSDLRFMEYCTGWGENTSETLNDNENNETYLYIQYDCESE